jgi:predicted membrane protein
MVLHLLTILIVLIIALAVIFVFYGFLVHNVKVRKNWKKRWIEEIKASDNSEEYKAGFIDGLKMTDVFDK